jgi:hypothetical protein
MANCSCEIAPLETTSVGWISMSELKTRRASLRAVIVDALIASPTSPPSVMIGHDDTSEMSVVSSTAKFRCE